MSMLLPVNIVDNSNLIYKIMAISFGRAIVVRLLLLCVYSNLCKLMIVERIKQRISLHGIYGTKPLTINAREDIHVSLSEWISWSDFTYIHFVSQAVTPSHICYNLD